MFVPLCHWTKEGRVTANGIYKLFVAYAKRASIQVEGLGVHGLCTTAATNALEHEAGIAKVQA
jgi:hypothetical protein